jgi:hypothetical protein
MNNDLDQYSVKKWIAGELIQMHKARGDQIFFVTKRINTGSERLTELLKKEFYLPNLEPVIFTNRGSKTPAFKRVQAVVSYGDSDGDIRESIEAGARPVRVLRARTSVNLEPVHHGAFGEEVLLNSEFEAYDERKVFFDRTRRRPIQMSLIEPSRQVWVDQHEAGARRGDPATRVRSTVAAPLAHPYPPGGAIRVYRTWCAKKRSAENPNPTCTPSWKTEAEACAGYIR